MSDLNTGAGKSTFHGRGGYTGLNTGSEDYWGDVYKKDKEIRELKERLRELEDDKEDKKINNYEKD